MHLLTVIEQQKMEYFNGSHPLSTNMDTFEYFRWMIKTGLEFSSSPTTDTSHQPSSMFGEGQYFGNNFTYIRGKKNNPWTSHIDRTSH